MLLLKHKMFSSHEGFQTIAIYHHRKNNLIKYHFKGIQPDSFSPKHGGGGGPAELTFMVFKLLLCLSSPNFPSTFVVLVLT